MSEHADRFTPTSWFTSSRSTAANACVEVAMRPDAVGVRDSKDPRGGTLVLNRSQWRAFLESLAR
ncbi:hypothetical protein GCM10027174_41310 [Salinifilum aidingensis]